MTMTGTEALGRLLARRQARVAAATWTKGEGGLFTGSETGGGGSDTQKGHRDGEPHSDSRIHRAIEEGIEALNGSSVHARVMEFSDKAGNTRNLELSNARETTRPDTPHSEIVPTIQQAAESPEGMTLDRPIVVNGIAVDARVIPTGGKTEPFEPGMTRDYGGGSAMMGAAPPQFSKIPKVKKDDEEEDDPALAKAKEEAAAKAEAEVEEEVDAAAEEAAPGEAPPPGLPGPPPPPPPGPGPNPKQVQENAERDQRIEELESTVKELRVELDGIEQLAVDNALADLDSFTAEGGEGEMPQSFTAAVDEKYALPPAFVASLPSTELPEAFVAAVDQQYALPPYTPGSFTAAIVFSQAAKVGMDEAKRKAESGEPRKKGFFERAFDKAFPPPKAEEKKAEGGKGGDDDPDYIKEEDGKFNGSRAKG